MAIIYQQGMNQQTPAVQSLLSRVGRATGSAPRRTKKSASARPAAGKRQALRKRSGKKKRAAKPARLVKGSLAAKRYMAKIRKLRGKRK